MKREQHTPENPLRIGSCARDFPDTDGLWPWMKDVDLKNGKCPLWSCRDGTVVCPNPKQEAVPQ